MFDTEGVTFVGFEFSWDPERHEQMAEGPLDATTRTVAWKPAPPEGWKVTQFSQLISPSERSKWTFYLHLDLEDDRLDTLRRATDDGSLVRRGRVFARTLGIPDNTPVRVIAAVCSS